MEAIYLPSFELNGVGFDGAANVVERENRVVQEI
jgi:hypothetical protein